MREYSTNSIPLKNFLTFNYIEYNLCQIYIMGCLMRVFAYAGLLFLALTASVSASESSWSFLPLPGNSADLTSLAPRWGEDGQGLIAASQSEIFIRSEKGLWETLSRTHPASISDLKCFEELPATTWVLTERGARVLESGRPDREIFPVSDSGASVQAWAVFPGEPARWFAGTSQGVFESRDQGKSWKALPLRTAEPVIGLHFVFQRLWIVTSGRVYSTKDLKSFRESFSLSASSREDGIIEMTPTPPEETADEELLAPILDSSSSAEPFQGLGIATRFGVFTLDPESGFWSRLPSRGLTGSAVTHLRFSSADGRVWAGTGDGIFGYDPSKRLWEKPSQTPSLGAITALEVMASSGAVAAASRRGVLLFVPGLLQNTPLKEPIAAEGLDLLKRIELYEPSVWKFSARRFAPPTQAGGRHAAGMGNQDSALSCPLFLSDETSIGITTLTLTGAARMTPTATSQGPISRAAGGMPTFPGISGTSSGAPPKPPSTAETKSTPNSETAFSAKSHGFFMNAVVSSLKSLLRLGKTPGHSWKRKFIWKKPPH